MIIAYDVRDRQSFESIRYWLKFKWYVGPNKMLIIFVVMRIYPTCRMLLSIFNISLLELVAMMKIVDKLAMKKVLT